MAGKITDDRAPSTLTALTLAGVLAGVNVEVPAEMLVDRLPKNLGLSITANSGTHALTIAMKQADGSSDPSAAGPVVIPMRSSTLTSGAWAFRVVTSALSLVISSGSTLGACPVASVISGIYVYVIDNAGALELAVSYKYFGQEGIVSTTAEGGAGGADTGTTMYSTTARSNVAFALIGFFKIAEATPGAWDTAPVSVQVGRIEKERVAFHANKNSSDQSGIASATQTDITFTNEVFDIGDYYDATNSDWYPPPGQVRVSCQMRLSGGIVDVNEISAIVRKGGGSNLQTTGQASGTGDQATMVNALYDVNGSQAIDVRLYAAGAGTKTVSGNASYTFFQGETI